VRSVFARGSERDKLGISDPGLGIMVGLGMAVGAGGTTRSGAGVETAAVLRGASSTGVAMFASAESEAGLAMVAGTVRPARYFAVVSGELSAADTTAAATRRNERWQRDDFKSQTETGMHREMFKPRE
jgi:hypothetical protein